MYAGSREWESICHLANRFSAARAKLTTFTVLSFGYDFWFRERQSQFPQSRKPSIKKGMGRSPMFTHRPCPSRTARESICFLAKWLSAPRAGLTCSTSPSFGYCPPQEVLRTAYGASPCGTHKPCEHVLAGKLTASAACGTDRFHNSVIRVCPPQEVLRTAYGASPCGTHKPCEHVLAGKLTASAACGDSRFHIPIIRVRNSAKRNCFCRGGRKAEYFAEISSIPHRRRFL